MRKAVYWLGGLVVVVVSFLITNWFLSDDLDWRFTDESSIATAATATGYHPTGELSGDVFSIGRIDVAKVTAHGWAVDLASDGSPITISAFVNGRKAATFRTNGPQPEITPAIKANPKASPDAAKNTKFEGTFACAAGNKLFVVATNAKKGYAILTPRPSVCP